MLTLVLAFLSLNVDNNITAQPLSREAVSKCIITFYGDVSCYLHKILSSYFFLFVFINH